MNYQEEENEDVNYREQEKQFRAQKRKKHKRDDAYAEDEEDDWN